MAKLSNLAQDVAIVGLGVAGLQRDSRKALGALVLDACLEAIRDAGVRKQDIDGIGGVYSTDLATVWPGYVSNGLGIGEVAWSSCASAPSMAAVMDGVSAVAAGVCETALIYHGKYRWDVTSSSARNDPLRQSPTLVFDAMLNSPLRRYLPGTNAMAAGMQRHMHDFGTTREHFGMIAVNNRMQAQNNPRAIFYGKPMTLDDYMSSPVIQSPFTMHDMDMPIDAASAVVLTTVERARDLGRPFAVVRDIANGVFPSCDHVFDPRGNAPAARFIIDRLYARSGVRAADFDYASLYDGFTIICMDWIEAMFGKEGDGADILEDAFDRGTGILKFLGRIPMNTHGGNLSEGRLQGMGQVLEAVTQLRNEAGPRQIPGAKRAMVTNAGNPIAVGMILEGAA